MPTTKAVDQTGIVPLTDIANDQRDARAKKMMVQNTGLNQKVIATEVELRKGMREGHELVGDLYRSQGELEQMRRQLPHAIDALVRDPVEEALGKDLVCEFKEAVDAVSKRVAREVAIDWWREVSPSSPHRRNP